MKRSIFSSLTPVAMASALIVSGCGPAPDRAAPTPGAESDWTATPLILQASRGPGGLKLTGVTAPGGRVVLRGGNTPAFATGSDEAGRFALTLSTPSADTVFAVESQRGEQAAPAPYALLVSHDPTGPIVMVAEGAPSRRLDGDGVMDAVDSDGRALLATGRAAPRSTVVIRAGDRAVDAIADTDGRWSAVLTSDGAGPMSIVIAGRRYDYPGSGAAPAADAGEVRLEPAGQGRRAVWRLGPGAWRSSWFPSS